MADITSRDFQELIKRQKETSLKKNWRWIWNLKEKNWRMQMLVEMQ